MHPKTFCIWRKYLLLVRGHRAQQGSGHQWYKEDDSFRAHFSLSIFCAIIISTLNLCSITGGNKWVQWTIGQKRQTESLHAWSLKSEASPSRFWLLFPLQETRTNYIFVSMTYLSVILVSEERSQRWPFMTLLTQSFWRLGLLLVQAVLIKRTVRKAHFSPWEMT